MHWIILVKIILNIIYKFHVNRFALCNLLTKYLVGKFYYYHQPKEVRLDGLTTAIVNVLVFWVLTPSNVAGKH